MPSSDSAPDGPDAAHKRTQAHDGRSVRRGGFELDVPGELVLLVVAMVCGTIVACVYLISSGGGC